MNELRIEEKARRYDEVVDEIKKLRDMLLKEGVINKDGIICDNFNRIFPELKEGEDEKIRKDLITFLDDVWYLGKKANFDKWDKADCSDWINWLENQGEQKSDTNFSDLRTWKYIVDAVWTEKEGIGQYLDSPFTEEVAKKLQKRFGNIGQNLANSVKTCKDEQNSVWSEEDEQNLNEALSYIKDDALKEFIKSLRPQKQWKPSKKQMEYLLKYGEQNNYDGAILTSLYNELKQL